MKNLFSWLTANWSEIVTTFTAVFTAILLYKQYKVQRNQVQWQMFEHQPLFQFTRTDDCLIVKNVGEAMSYPATIKILTLLRADTISHPKKDKRSRCLSCIPFKYIEDIVYTNNLEGELARCKFVEKSDREEFLQVVRDFEHEVTKETFDHRLHKYRSSDDYYYESIKLSEVVSVEYTDRYGNRQEVYFWDSCRISKDIFWQLLNSIERGGIYGNPFSRRITPFPLKIASEEFLMHQFCHKLVIGEIK